MGSQPWLDRVREWLAKHALPPSYVQRFMEELRDHLDDLKEESMEADAISQLGEPEHVAEAAITAYRRRSFVGRHPTAAFLVFGISPLASFIILLATVALVTLLVSCDENDWVGALMIVFCSTIATIFYGELAAWLGLGKKWTLVSCAVLGTIAVLCELGSSVPVMLPMQFAAPFVVRWWLVKRKCDRPPAAATLVIFVMSPVALYAILDFLVLRASVIAYRFPQEHFGPGAADCSSFLFLFVAPTAVAGFVCCKLAKGFRSGRKWMLVACVVLVTFPATLFIVGLPLHVVPPAAASFLYCTVAKRLGLARKWILVACMMLAVYAATQSFSEVYMLRQCDSLDDVGDACRILARLLVPLAIGFWFLQRNRDQGGLEVAS